MQTFLKNFTIDNKFYLTVKKTWLKKFMIALNLF